MGMTGPGRRSMGMTGPGGRSMGMHPAVVR